MMVKPDGLHLLKSYLEKRAVKARFSTFISAPSLFSK